MKIERLNENSIRCTLDRNDLDSRELKISELAYGTDKAKTLFKDMIAQASFECGFDAEDIPLMIEAIPVSTDCIVLVITKVEDPDELDTRFSRFSPADDDDDYLDMLDDDDDGSASKEFSGASPLLGKIDDSLNSDDSFVPFMESFARRNNTDGIGELGNLSPAAPEQSAEEPAAIRFEKLFSFKDFSHAAAAAAAVYTRFRGESVLFKNVSDFRYYLFVCSSDMQADEFTGICNILTEYGTREKFSYATLSYLEEHDDVIIRKDALRVLATL